MDDIAFLQALTHVAFICFVSRHEYTRWKLRLIAKLKTFGFPFLLDSAGMPHSLLGSFFWVVLVCFVLFWFFFRPPFLTQQKEAGGFLVDCLRSICYIWAILLLFIYLCVCVGGGGVNGLSNALVVVGEQHLPASSSAQPLPHLSRRGLACFSAGWANGLSWRWLHPWAP